MITRIEVDGFKSLRGFSLDFEPLTAVVGANGAGKSNVFDVLRLLSCLPRMNIVDAFRSLRGNVRDQFSQTKDGPVEQLTITTDFLFVPLPNDEETNRWRHFIRVERMPTNATITETLEVTEERLWNLRENEDDWMMRHSAFRPLVRYRDSVMTAGRPAVPKSMFPMSLQSSMARLDQSGVHPLATELTNIRLLHPDPGKLRLPSDRAAGATLLADGSNLPTALAATTPEIRAQIRADLADLVPGFRSFEVVPHDDELRLEIE
ncbi:MAG TPA: AAA family ATPase, partial [Polyangium sp.]|nr:AAA family ATPase [Polyangium sp.]